MRNEKLLNIWHAESFGYVLCYLISRGLFVPEQIPQLRFVSSRMEFCDFCP